MCLSCQDWWTNCSNPWLSTSQNQTIAPPSLQHFLATFPKHGYHDRHSSSQATMHPAASTAQHASLQIAVMWIHTIVFPRQPPDSRQRCDDTLSPRSCSLHEGTQLDESPEVHSSLTSPQALVSRDNWYASRPSSGPGSLGVGGERTRWMHSSHWCSHAPTDGNRQAVVKAIPTPPLRAAVPASHEVDGQSLL